MTPKEMAEAILDDLSHERRCRRIRGLLSRQRRPLSDPIATAIIAAGGKLEGRASEWYIAIYCAGRGEPIHQAGYNEDLMGRLIALETMSLAEAQAMESLFDAQLRGAMLPLPAHSPPDTPPPKEDSFLGSNAAVAAEIEGGWRL